jgi:uncharacterized membrane protein YgcG
MSFPYKNPLSSVQLTGPQSVSRTSVFGTNFSVNNVGGYMEVYNLSDLNYSTYGETGLINLSANTIPVQYTVGGLFNSLTLNSDNISSGRRRLGMLVYVNETNQVYQYTIPNYTELWSSLSGLTGISAITQTEYSTVVNTRSPQGAQFVNAWLNSSIEGVDGVEKENARWQKFYGTDTFITGGTFYSATTTLDLVQNNGETISISGFSQSSEAGTQGTSGTSGSSGTSGTDGTSGTSGSDGTSGTSGSDGTSGSSGTTGSSGTDGTSGTSGSDGTSGSSGTTGSSGTDGTSGTSGSDGTSGTSGTDGSSGTSGSDGISSG